MIGRLRRKFVLCALAALVVTFGLVCAAINVGSHVLITRRADETIALLREGGGGAFLKRRSTPTPSSTGCSV